MNDRPRYGPSPSRRKKLDELWMEQGEDVRRSAAGVVVQSLQGIVASDGTLAPSALPLSDAEPPAVTLGGSGGAGTDDTAARGDHAHDGPTDPVPAHEAASNPHPGYLTPAELAALFTAKGDMLVGTGAGTYAALPAPASTGYYLRTDPTEPTGLRWVPLPDALLDLVLDGADQVVDGTDRIIAE